MLESLSMTNIYGRRQTAKITSDFLLFPCYLKINHTKIETCLLLFTAANTNTSILLYRELKTDGKVSFSPFAVNVMLNLSIINYKPL